MKQAALFFDFDGVILHSVNIKTEAFRDMYLPYGKEIADKVVAYHLEHGGVSRFEKFRVWHKEYFNETISEERVQELAQQFSDLVFEKVLACPAIEGVEDFLAEMVQQYPIYVASGTPQDELRKITAARGYDKYFTGGVYGSPEKKADIVGRLVYEKGIDAARSFFFGDAGTDLKAAHEHGLPFILVKSPDNLNLVDESEYAIDDFVGFTLPQL